MTRIIKIEKTGDPEVLKLETIDLKKPAPEEVTIEHKAIGLNFIDGFLINLTTTLIGIISIIISIFVIKFIKIFVLSFKNNHK